MMNMKMKMRLKVKERQKKRYRPRVLSASNHVEAGFTLFRVGHTERQAGQFD